MQKDLPKYQNDLRKRCFVLSKQVIRLCDTFPQKRSSWVIADQVIRSTTSIGANLVEARASSSRLEYKKFYEIALKSANETIYWLELIIEIQLVADDQVLPLLQEVQEVANMLGAGVIKLKAKLS